jgi:S-adenosylmethionine decarboxylase
MVGIEWVVDATGCDADLLRDQRTLERLFAALIEAARLTPVGAPAWHRFPHTGGLTGLQVLAESHLACHTFPEHGSFCLNVFCCVPRLEWQPERAIRAVLDAKDVRVRRLERTYGRRLSSIAQAPAGLP